MNDEAMIPIERIEKSIYLIRGKKVMLDRDLAALYGVETRVLKQAVNRNIDRFPDDFMFVFTAEELADWRSQFVTSKSDRMGRIAYPPGLWSSDYAQTWRCFAVDAYPRCATFASDHPHDGPRTWIRGRMAPRRLRPAGFFLPSSVGRAA